MKCDVLVPFKKANFIREVIKHLEADRDFDYGYDDWSDEKIMGFKIGINNAILYLQKEIEKREDKKDGC